MLCLPKTFKVLHTNISEEGDPIISCYFKTEFTTHLLKLTQASVNVTMGPMYVCSPDSVSNLA